MKRLFACTLLLFCAVTTSYAETTPYQINAGDVLRIFVWNEEELSGEMMVDPQGQLSFPMVGAIDAAGLSTTQLGSAISNGLGNYLRDKPVVTVSIMRVVGNKVFVLGRVARPGEFVMSTQMDVAQALALAGGLDEFAAENDIRILRRDASGNQRSMPFHYAKVKSGKSLETNILLQAGDIVVVP